MLCSMVLAMAFMGTKQGVMASDNTVVVENLAQQENLEGVTDFLNTSVSNETVVRSNNNNGKWIQNSTGWWYRYADGTYPKNGWATIDGAKYYFNASGYMQTGWIKDNGKWYYLESSGRMAANKWISNTYYVGTDGSMAVNRWIDNIYYVKSNGKKAISEWVDNGKYYVDTNGKWVQNKTNGKWIQDSIGWWYRYADGTYPKNGWVTIDGAKYHFNASGYMQTGWIKDNGKYYYLESSGRPAVNKWISGAYYVKADGSMAVSEWVDNNKYYVDANGKWVKNKTNGKWIQNSTGWWYRYADGTYPKNGWATIDGAKYYFNANGYRQTGWIKDNGKYYYLEGSGRPATNKWISGTYYVKADGSMAVSEWVDNNKYYVDANGKKIAAPKAEQWETPIL